jgi:antitoxin HigA-1
MAKTLPPMHPGEVLREEFLIPMALSPYALAKICDVPRTRIERIVREEISVTADTALRLSKALGTTAGLWLNLQSRYPPSDQVRGHAFPDHAPGNQWVPSATGRNACSKCGSSLPPIFSMVAKASACVNGSR